MDGDEEHGHEEARELIESFHRVYDVRKRLVRNIMMSYDVVGQIQIIQRDLPVMMWVLGVDSPIHAINCLILVLDLFCSK